MSMGRLGMILLIFLLAIIGIPLLTSITDTTFKNSQLTTVAGENITTDVAAVRLIGNSVDPNVDIELTNNYARTVTEVQLNGSVLTDGTDYQTTNSNEGLVLRLINTTATGGANLNESNVTYTYGQEYISSAPSRTLINLIPLFYVLGIVLLILGAVFKDQLMDLIRR